MKEWGLYIPRLNHHAFNQQVLLLLHFKITLCHGSSVA